MGDNAIDEHGYLMKNGYLDWSAKYNCIKKNNVKLLMTNDIKPLKIMQIRNMALIMS